MAIQDIDLGTVIENGEDGDVARTAFTKVNENFDDLDARVTYIESLDIGTVTSVNDILPVDGNVDLTPADIGAATAAQGAKADTAVQSDVFATALNQKVDKVEGYQLSQEDYTTAEKDKLASLESSLFLGVYSSLAELEAAHPTSDRPGEYAFIPSGGNIYMFVWDVVTGRWVTIGTGSEAITAEQVKILYESNPNTNAFTDLDVSNLNTALTTANSANNKVDSIFAEGVPNKGAGTIPYSEQLEYPAGSAGAAIKDLMKFQEDLNGVGGAALVRSADGQTVQAHITRLSAIKIVNPSTFGAVGDGVTDDTAAMQAAFDSVASGAYIMLEPGKNYAVTRLDLPSNSTIDLCHSVITKLPGDTSPDHLLRADAGCHNTLVKNGKLVGDKLTHLNGTGEGVHNIFLYPGCYDLTFCNIETVDAFGDGFYTGDFGTEAAPKNIRLMNVRAVACRRQGFSITSANGLLMVDCSADEIGDSVGPWPLPAGPWGGLDIEPNYPRSVLDNIVIRNFQTRNCKGMGMGFALIYKMRGLTVAESFNITVDGHTDFGSGEGFFCIGGSIGGSGGPNARLIGRVLLMNQTFLNNKENGINVAHWSTAKGADANAGPVLEIVRPTVINYGRSGNPSVLRSSGIQLHNSHPSGNDYGSMRGIKITEPASFVQPDVTAATGHAINIANSVSGRAVVDIRIEDVSRIVGRISCLSGASDVRVSGTPESVPFSAATGQTIGYGGVLATHVTAASGAALTIGQNAIGSEMEVSGIGSVTLTAASGVTLRDATGAVITTVTLTTSGATVRLKWISATAVLVSKIYGSITP